MVFPVCDFLFGRGKQIYLVQMFPEADVIFIEGMKETSFPKIEVIREGISLDPVSNPEGRFLIVTDRNPEDYREDTARFEETGRIVDRILQEGWKDYEG